MIITKYMEVPDLSARDGDVVLEVTQETDGLNPRECSDFGHMVCWANRYRFGQTPQDRNVRSEGELVGILADILAESLDLDADQKANVENNNTVGDLMRAIVKHTKTVVLPLYLLDHSGLSISTSSRVFDMVDPGSWDHGQVGIIYMTENEIKKEYGAAEITEEVVKKAKDALRNEVHTYDLYLQGEVYYFRLYRESTDEDIDSCGGFYCDGTEELKSALKPHIPAEYHGLVDNLEPCQY